MHPCIAILGNTNNNHFSLMRYFRDLGLDVSLLLYSTDGLPPNAHFIPENDTWEFERWRPYIIRTPVPNGSIKGLTYVFRKSALRKMLSRYNILIGNGFAPAYAWLAGRILDLFLPYSHGGEFINTDVSGKVHSDLSAWVQKRLQISGLRNSVKYTGTADFTEGNLRFFRKYGINNLINLAIPMVYNREIIHSNPRHLRPEVAEIAKTMDQTGFVVFSHVSHIWKNLVHGFDLKKNQIFLQGFAGFIRMVKNMDIRLFMIEYGPDVDASKKLIAELGMNDHVTWLSKMSRKEIMYLLRFVDIGASEFGGAMWGGTGWEFIASGVPFMHYIDLEQYTFEQVNGYPLPPIFNTRTPEEIAQVLLEASQNRTRLHETGEKLKKWFNTYNGIALAEKIAALVLPQE
jgi:hypothetical protein